MHIIKLLLRGFSYGAAFFILLAAGLPLAYAEGDSKDTVRPEVGKPLQAAQELMKAQRYKEALAKVREADAIGGKTPYESFVLDRMRGAAASGAGETDTAIKSFESAIASGRLAAADQLKVVEALAGTAYRGKDYAKAQHWAVRYFRDGGTGTQMRSLLAQSQYLAGDYAGAAKEMNAEIAAVEAAGSAPAEDRLQLLANCYLKLNDKAGYIAVLEKLVSHHPKKEYWADLLARIQRKQGFSDRLALDVYRLMLVTGNLNETSDFMEMAQLALQAGLPAEAKRVVEDGFAKGALGGGSDEARHKRLRELASKQAADDLKTLGESEKQANAAPDGNPLVALGFAYISTHQFDKGIALLEQGIAKGGIKRLEEAKLHLGMAYLQAGNKDKARHTLRSVQGGEGAADIARLWLIQGWRGT